MDITRKTIGELVDGLITTDIKCFMLQESLMKEDLTAEKRSDLAIKIQQLNARRNSLINGIDKMLGQEEFTPTEKTYK